MKYFSIICSLLIENGIFEECNLSHSIEFVSNPIHDRFRESGNGIGYLVTHPLLGGHDKLLQNPLSSLLDAGVVSA